MNTTVTALAKARLIVPLLGIIFLFVIINYALSEVVILKDGNKYIGKITDEGDTLRIATPDGEMTVKKDRIKAIYKDAAAILKETTDTLVEAKSLIDGANKIDDPKERNASLDKSLEMLNKAQNICMDVVDVFAGEDGKAIGNQLKDINSTMKQARSLKVMDKELPPPKEDKKSVSRTPEPSQPDSSEVDKSESEPRSADPEKIEAAKEVYNLGVEALKDKKYENARDLFLKSISYYEDYAEAYAKLGDAYTALKEEELGYENYRKFLEITDRSVSLSDELAKLREEVVKKTEKFKPIEDKINNLARETVAKLMDLGKKCLDEEDYILAEDIFSLVLKIEKDNKEAQENLEKAREKLEKEQDNEK
ncbi:MAG: hypothetical protein HZA49_00650 [Planctomycetes bacterium]|nr:hypothetical protein [Planctomycetota bacterium]